MSLLKDTYDWLFYIKGKSWKDYLAEVRNNEKEDNKDNSEFFFKSIKWITRLLLSLGILAAVLIYFTHGEVYKAVALIFLLIWLVVFLRYFLWSVYHYNINYGLTAQDWRDIKAERKKKNDGELFDKFKVDNAPKYNPYRSQTFGLPPGTVRGMIAFTLLFGAITILIASFGMTKADLQSSLIRDQFEFFKTAFLMMIAFYFGDKSLRYLQKRWKDPNKDNSGRGAGSGDLVDSETSNQVDLDDVEFLDDDKKFELTEEPAESEEIRKNKKAGILKKLLNSGLSNSILDPVESDPWLFKNRNKKPSHSMNDSQPEVTSRIPIIDSGHGGVDDDGNYTTTIGKKYKFTGEDQGGFEILEGVINRKIAQKLIAKLEAAGIAYYDLNSTDQNDMPLRERVKIADKLYSDNNLYYYLSIHSNSASSSLEGTGTTAHGYEIFTSKGSTASDLFAKIAAEKYKTLFPDKRFRGLKEANYYVLKYTDCPAFLVENLFFDNYEEAKYLSSDKGQDEIANCLFETIKSIT